MADPSSFYRLNEEIARELARLAGEGKLSRLAALLRDAGAELQVTSARPREGLEELLGVLAGEGWDHEGYMAARSQFSVVMPDGAPREVYMPDHICPGCANEEGNAIDSCSRVCGVCGFSW